MFMALIWTHTGYAIDPRTPQAKCSAGHRRVSKAIASPAEMTDESGQIRYEWTMTRMSLNRSRLTRCDRRLMEENLFT